MLDIVITSFITLVVYHIIPGFQCNNTVAQRSHPRTAEDSEKEIEFSKNISSIIKNTFNSNEVHITIVESVD